MIDRSLSLDEIDFGTEAERCERFAAMSLPDDKAGWLALAERWRALAAQAEQVKETPALRSPKSVRLVSN